MKKPTTGANPPEGHPEGYWCVVCGRFLPADDGVIIHDNVPHPEMLFDEEDKPQ